MGIQIEIKGIPEVKKFLENANKDVLQKANQAVIKAGFYVQGEVQESIAGHRAEPASVDTGRFLNSVKAQQQGELTATIFTNVPYAEFLEYGTSRIAPRHHFTNTASRSEVKIKNFINEAIRK